MSQTKLQPHKITIKQRVPDQVSTGFNTEVFLDGKPLKGVTFLKIEMKPRKVTKVVIELVSEVEVLDTVIEDIVFKEQQD